MAPSCPDQKSIPTVEFDRLLAVLEAQLGTALEQGHPFMLLLVVPEAFRARRTTGMDAFQPQLGGIQQNADAFLPGGRSFFPQQVDVAVGRCLALPPAPADLEPLEPCQLHHLAVVTAGTQRLPQRRVGMDPVHKGLELLHLVEKPLQIGFGHGGERGGVTPDP
jgi:hypothetical protein